VTRFSTLRVRERDEREKGDALVHDSALLLGRVVDDDALALRVGAVRLVPVLAPDARVLQPAPGRRRVVAVVRVDPAQTVIEGGRDAQGLSAVASPDGRACERAKRGTERDEVSAATASNF